MQKLVIGMVWVDFFWVPTVSLGEHVKRRFQLLLWIPKSIVTRVKEIIHQHAVDYMMDLQP